MMYRQHFWHGNGIVRGTAISGIDIALWDILGKIHGVPCHKLWGGPVRDYVRLYSPSRRREDGGFLRDAIPPTRSGSAISRSRPSKKDSPRSRSMAVPETMPLEGLQPIRYAEACVKAMRDAVGESIDIMVDCHARPSPRMGMLFAKALEPYGLYWFEEPCWPETIDDIALIQRAVKTPIATGERLVGLARLSRAAREARRQRHPTRHHALRRPDRSAADRRAGRGVSRRHGAAQSAGPGQHGRVAGVRLRDAELHHLRNGARRRAVAAATSCSEGFTVEKKGRIVRPNTRPGLGIEINEAEVKKHPFQQEELLRTFYKDGSVGDW